MMVKYEIERLRMSFGILALTPTSNQSLRDTIGAISLMLVIYFSIKSTPSWMSSCDLTFLPKLHMLYSNTWKDGFENACPSVVSTLALTLRHVWNLMTVLCSLSRPILVSVLRGNPHWRPTSSTGLWGGAICPLNWCHWELPWWQTRHNLSDPCTQTHINTGVGPAVEPIRL